MITIDNLLYVGRNKGEFEGRSYDSVALSDGVRTYKFRSPSDLDTSGYKEEETRCTGHFKLTSGQNNQATLKLNKLTKK